MTTKRYKNKTQKKRVEIKISSTKTFKFSGFLYYESYCYEDCCEHYSGYCIMPCRASKTVEECHDCENDRIFVDNSEGKRKVNGLALKMIEECLGRKVDEGEFIDVEFNVKVDTPDSVLLQDDA